MTKRSLGKIKRPEGIESSKSIYPLFFWKTCCSCNQEFRREWGTKLQVHHWVKGFSVRYEGMDGINLVQYLFGHYGYMGCRTLYLCHECSTTGVGLMECLTATGINMFCSSPNAPEEI